MHYLNFSSQIRVYPTMQFESQTAQYISTNFFEKKAKDEKNYKSIVTIFGILTYFPFATFTVVSYLAFTYSNRIAIYASKYLKVDVDDAEDSKNSKSKKENEISTFWSLLCDKLEDDYKCDEKDCDKNNSKNTDEDDEDNEDDEDDEDDETDKK